MQQAIDQLIAYATALPGRMKDFDPIDEAKRLELLAFLCREVGGEKPNQIEAHLRDHRRRARIQKMDRNVSSRQSRVRELIVRMHFKGGLTAADIHKRAANKWGGGVLGAVGPAIQQLVGTGELIDCGDGTYRRAW
jgi:hypothetical protein